MSDTPDPSTLDRLQPHLPPDFTDQDRTSACTWFDEIVGKSYEQVAVILTIQHKLVSQLSAIVSQDNDKRVIESALKQPKPTVITPSRGIIRPRGN
jgi:hypothetical protein